MTRRLVTGRLVTRRLVTRRLVRLGVVTVVVAAAAMAGCAKLDTAPGHVVSIFVDTVPYPSVVENDTLRDTLGHVVPLKGQAYNLAGDDVSTGLQFLSLDPNLVRITTGTNYAIAGDSAPTTVRIIAQGQTLQTTPFNLAISLRPDTVSPDSVIDSAGAPTTSDTAQLIRGFCGLTGTVSSQLVAWLRHKTVAGDSGVDNYIMRWQITNPDSIAGTGSISDTAHLAFLVSSSGVPSVRDTTKGGGFSTRYLEFGGEAFKRLRVDTDTVAVTVRFNTTYRGVLVPGTDSVIIRFVNPSSC